MATYDYERRRTRDENEPDEEESEEIEAEDYESDERKSDACGLDDDLWSRVVDKLSEEGDCWGGCSFGLPLASVRAAVELGKTCRQLRRVVFNSGLVASLVSWLVIGVNIADDKRSLVLRADGLQLSCEQCWMLLRAMEVMERPEILWGALVRDPWTGNDDFFLFSAPLFTLVVLRLATGEHRIASLL